MGDPRPTRLTGLSRSFGGRSLTDDSDAQRPGAGPQTWAERAVAYRTWRVAAHWFEDQEPERPDELRFRDRYAELLIAGAVIVFFVGAYTAFIVWLAHSG